MPLRKGFDLLSCIPMRFDSVEQSWDGYYQDFRESLQVTGEEDGVITSEAPTLKSFTTYSTWVVRPPGKCRFVREVSVADIAWLVTTGWSFFMANVNLCVPSLSCKSTKFVVADFSPNSPTVSRFNCISAHFSLPVERMKVLRDLYLRTNRERLGPSATTLVCKTNQSCDDMRSIGTDSQSWGGGLQAVLLRQVFRFRSGVRRFQSRGTRRSSARQPRGIPLRVAQCPSLKCHGSTRK
jgi:hypothetical protein